MDGRPAEAKLKQPGLGWCMTLQWRIAGKNGRSRPLNLMGLANYWLKFRTPNITF